MTLRRSSSWTTSDGDPVKPQPLGSAAGRHEQSRKSPTTAQHHSKQQGSQPAQVTGTSSHRQRTSDTVPPQQQGGVQTDPAQQRSAAAAAEDAEGPHKTISAASKRPQHFPQEYLASLDFPTMQKLGFYMLSCREVATESGDGYAVAAARHFRVTTGQRRRINFNAFLHCRPYNKRACLEQLPEQIAPLISEMDNHSRHWTPGVTLAMTPAIAMQRYAAMAAPTMATQWTVPQITSTSSTWCQWPSARMHQATHYGSGNMQPLQPQWSPSQPTTNYMHAHA